MFSQKKFFLIFQEIELSYIFLLFWEMELFSPSLKFSLKFLIFLPKKKRSEKISYIYSKNVFLIFRKIELFSPRLKKLLIFHEGTFQAPKNKKTTLKKLFMFLEIKLSFISRGNFKVPGLKKKFYIFLIF